MRMTEGVWMSVTPTEDDLIVVLDFEGNLSLTMKDKNSPLIQLNCRST